MSLISLKNITFSYWEEGNNPILKDLSFSIDSKDITVITGPSGCGKSTLLYLTAGIYPENGGNISKGKVLINEQDPGIKKPYQRTELVGMMFQNTDLQFCMDTVENELIFCLENNKVLPEKMDEIIEKALKFCEIFHLKKRKLTSLSGGEKQKAMLACVVAMQPKWIFLDEPFANIDRETSRQLIEKLKKLHKEKEIGIFAVDHHVDLWKDVADSCFVMEKDSQIRKMKNPEVETFYQKTKPIKKSGKITLTLNCVQVKQNKKKFFGNFNGEFREGNIYAIIGKSGSGKTTLLNTLGRMYKYRGSILLNEAELKHIPIRKMSSKMGFVFQNPQDQFVADTIYDEVALTFRGKIHSEKKVEEILRKVNLWKYRKISPYMLSQGQQRKLGVITLLAYDCDILICDEPTYAQDRENLLVIMDMLQNMVIEKNITLIFTTHDLQLAFDYADKVYKLEDGKLNEIT